MDPRPLRTSVKRKSPTTEDEDGDEDDDDERDPFTATKTASENESKSQEEKVKDEVESVPEKNNAFRTQLADPEWRKRVLDTLHVIADAQWLDLTMTKMWPLWACSQVYIHRVAPPQGERVAEQAERHRKYVREKKHKKVSETKETKEAKKTRQVKTLQECGYSHTVGLEWLYGHPELLIVGYTKSQSKIVLNKLAQLIRTQACRLNNAKTSDGNPNPIHVFLDDDIHRYPLQVRPLTREQVETHFERVNKLATAMELPLPRHLQIVWPDLLNHFDQLSLAQLGQFVF